MADDLIDKELERLRQPVCWMPDQRNERTGAGTRSTMIVFAISLKSRKWAKNWVRVQDNLARTLRSLWAQSHSNFRVVVAGHERPDIPELDDERCTWLPANVARPNSVDRLSSDKIAKRKVIGAYLREIDYSGYVMALDADDLVHRHFVAHLLPFLDGSGILLRAGFVINSDAWVVWGRGGRFGGKAFFRGCGSCFMAYFEPADLPSSPHGKLEDHQRFRLILSNHTNLDELLRQRNEPLYKIDMPLVAWLQGHGENNSLIKGKNKWMQGTHVEQPISPELVSAFSL